MDNFLFIGGGDGRVKKLDLISGKWNLTHEAQLEGKVTSLSTDLSYLVHTEAHFGSVNDMNLGSTRSDQFCCIDSAGACKVWDSSE